MLPIKNLFWQLRLLLLLFLIILPSLVFAHSGDGPHNGLLHGFVHPLTGLDHILAMGAVGLWAAQTGGRMIWLLPLIFVAVMGLGGLFGAIALSPVLAEYGIMLSLLILGLLIMRGKCLPRIISIMLISLFALCHGYAHGSEMPQSMPFLSYATGFMIATTLLHLCGIGVALLFRRLGGINWQRCAGIVVALYGGFLLVG